MPISVIYDDGHFKVTTSALHVFRKTYPLGRVERIGLKADPFYIGLPISGLLCLFALSFSSILYWSEIIMLVGLSAGIFGLTHDLSVLYIQTGSQYAPAAIWRKKRLEAFYQAAIQALPHH